MLSALKPQSKLLVYDLVTDAGLDTSDWTNYKKPAVPGANPKYCYEWAFWDTEKKTIVLCLWYSQMEEDSGVIFQTLNYRKVGLESSGVRVKRAQHMDRAIQMAAKYRLPIRVIVVDGIRRGEDDAKASKVARRMLDPVSWSVSSYDADTGDCRLRRGPGEIPQDAIATDQSSGKQRLARIAYNSTGWQRPTGEAGAQESDETYNAQNKFGHEDWLFRAEWVIDGWRYAFIQGLNKNRRTYLGQSLDVTLYTLQPDRRRRLVATIYGLESLSDEQARAALDAFRERGWLKTMQNDVTAIGGNAEALGAPKWAEHVLNVRYRLENVDSYPPGTFLAEDDWILNRHRYMLYKFEDADRDRVEITSPGRRGKQEASEARKLFRRGTKPVEYTPEHHKMQAKLLVELQAQYGREHVWLEKDFVDARVETDKELIFYEIKTDLDPRAVIRQALGQILEYAYHPARGGRRPDSLVVVGRTALGPADEAYLKNLCERFKLPLSYRVVTI